MQAVHDAAAADAAPDVAVTPAHATAAAASASAYQGYQIIRRNGAVVAFEPNKIAVALMKAFLAVHGTQGAASASVRETVDGLTETVVRALLRSRPGGGTFHIEDVQDQVELGLMRGGHHEVARAYVLYRERRTQERARQAQAGVAAEPVLHVTDRGQRVPLDLARLQAPDRVGLRRPGRRRAGPSRSWPRRRRNLYDGVPIDEVHKAAILAARTLIEKDPGYTRATARLLLHTIRKEILGEEVRAGRDAARATPSTFRGFIKKGVERRTARRAAAAVRPGAAGRGAQGRARPAVRLPRPADAVRPLLPAHRRAAHRAAAGLLHARGDGPGAERDRPRGARHRVLRRAVELRLHVEHADAVQRRHAALAAVELLPDDGVRRPRRHLRGAEGERAAVQVRRRPGQRLDQRARARLATSRAPTARARAWCRS